MEQHPIPQQISSYQFRLVGDMTLKQFFQVAAGVLVSLLIYSSGLHPIIKWPLIIFSFALGAALAFLPFEERPLSRWILAFFKAIYSPTIFFWKKEETYNFFQEEAIVPKEEGLIIPHGEVVLENYLKELPNQGLTFLSNLESYEQSFLGKIKDIFAAAITPLKPEVYKQEEIETKKELKQPSAPPIASIAPSAKPGFVAAKGFRAKIVIEEKPLQEEAVKPKDITSPVSPTLTEKQITSQQAQFSPGAAPPNPPTIPNTIVGQVIDPSGKIVEGAILEIRDIAGRPVRALRSNKLGHFMIVTSLNDGTYDIITEKEGYIFDPVTFEATGEIIPSIAIKAKAVVTTPQPVIPEKNGQNITII